MEKKTFSEFKRLVDSVYDIKQFYEKQEKMQKEISNLKSNKTTVGNFIELIRDIDVEIAQQIADFLKLVRVAGRNEECPGHGRSALPAQRLPMRATAGASLRPSGPVCLPAPGSKLSRMSRSGR